MSRVKLFEIEIDLEDNTAHLCVDEEMFQALNIDKAKFSDNFDYNKLIDGVNEFRRALRENIKDDSSNE